MTDRCRLLAIRLVAVVALALSVVATASGQPAPGSLARWFLAEGATGWLFDMNILIANPNATAAEIKITYLRRFGRAPVERTLQMPATSRATVRVNDVAEIANEEVSAVVECTNGLDILVERSMYWPRTGWHAGHHAPGVTATSERWFLAEGATRGFFDDFVLVANPDPVNDAVVRFTFLPESGPSFYIERLVAKNERENVYIPVDADVTALAGSSFSTLVESRTPGVGIVAERAMYWGPNWKGGHGSVGLPALAAEWRFAEGYTGANPTIGRFETWFLLANPDQAQAAHVTATYYKWVGAPVERTYEVGPGKRLTIPANAIPELADSGFATVFRSDIPIAAERAVYWGHNGVWTEGHDSPGVTAQATKWGFAEGTIENGFDSYFLVQNAGTSDITVHATFMLENGTGVTRDYGVRRESRFDISRANNLPPELAGRRFATMLESTAPFVAERATYWGAAWTGGHASAGTPWPGTIATPPAATLPTPTLTSVSPASGYTTGGLTVTLTGTEFVAGATVTFGGVAASSVTIPLGSSTTMTAVTPPHAYGTVDVAVTNPNGRRETLAAAFTYVPPEPVLLVPDTLAFGDSITGNWETGQGVTSILDPVTSLPVPWPVDPGQTYPSVLRSRLASQFPVQTVTVQNAGKPGEWSVDGKLRLPTVIDGAVHDVVIILEGVNDINNMAPISSIIDSLREMVDGVLNTGKRVILSTLTPVTDLKSYPDRVASVNTGIRTLALNYAGDPRFLLVDMFVAFPESELPTLLSPDGLHLTVPGYQRMADTFFDAIVAHFSILPIGG